MITAASIDDELAWLALQASGVEGSADISRCRFADELQRLRTPARLGLDRSEISSVEAEFESAAVRTRRNLAHD